MGGGEPSLEMSASLLLLFGFEGILKIQSQKMSQRSLAFKFLVSESLVWYGALVLRRLFYFKMVFFYMKHPFLYIYFHTKKGKTAGKLVLISQKQRTDAMNATQNTPALTKVWLLKQSRKTYKNTILDQNCEK